MKLKKDIIEILQKTFYPEQSLDNLFEMDWASTTKENEIFFLSHNLTLKAELSENILFLNDFKVNNFYEEAGVDLMQKLLEYSFANKEIEKIKVYEDSNEVKNICNSLNLKEEENTFIMCFTE